MIWPENLALSSWNMNEEEYKHHERGWLIIYFVGIAVYFILGFSVRGLLTPTPTANPGLSAFTA
jgi:hypothetical protein